MSATLEVINNKFLVKFGELSAFFKGLNELFSLPEVARAGCQKTLFDQYLFTNLILEDIENLEQKYHLQTTQALCVYYVSKGESEIDWASREYFKIIDIWSFSNQLEEITKKAQKILNCILSTYIKKYYPKQKNQELNVSDKNWDVFYKFRSSIDGIKNTKIDTTSHKNDYKECACGYKMDLDSATSEVRCPNCLELRSLDGTVFEDPQGSNKETTVKSKGSNSQPNRHYNFWMDRLLGKGSKTISSQDDKKIDYIIKRDGLELSNVYEMRKVLKEVKLTNYNDHAPLIMKLKTGVSPPQPDFATLRRMSCKFNRIIEGLNELLSDEENNPYYPYFIYKLLEGEEEEFLKKGNRTEAQNLKRLRTKYIYLQSDDTIAKNDALYQKICDLPGNEAFGLNFKPTDRNDN